MYAYINICRRRAHDSTLQGVAGYCSVLQRVAVSYHECAHGCMYINLCRRRARGGMLQCVAVCCSVLQCVAVCRRVMSMNM